MNACKNGCGFQVASDVQEVHNQTCPQYNISVPLEKQISDLQKQNAAFFYRIKQVQETVKAMSFSMRSSMGSPYRIQTLYPVLPPSIRIEAKTVQDLSLKKTTIWSPLLHIIKHSKMCCSVSLDNHNSSRLRFAFYFLPIDQFHPEVILEKPVKVTYTILDPLCRGFSPDYHFKEHCCCIVDAKSGKNRYPRRKFGTVESQEKKGSLHSITGTIEKHDSLDITIGIYIRLPYSQKSFTDTFMQLPPPHLKLDEKYYDSQVCYLRTSTFQEDPPVVFQKHFSGEEEDADWRLLSSSLSRPSRTVPNFCSNCGKKNIEKGNFCSSCGKPF